MAEWTKVLAMYRLRVPITPVKAFLTPVKVPNPVKEADRRIPIKL